MAWQFVSAGVEKWNLLFSRLGGLPMRPAGCARFLDDIIPVDVV